MSQPSSLGPAQHSSRSPFASRPDLGTVGSVLDGRYRIEHVVGEGGMGVVARATDLRLDRTVAVKLLHSEYADQEDVLERFAREAMVIAKLRSRHVVSVLDVSTDRQNPYLVLEYLEGESLEDRIFRDGPLPLGEAVRYARQVAEALEEAHGVGILHRDIKPANVFLARQPNHEQIAQILDFGTARFYDAKRAGQLSKPTITKQYETFGSPAYMPPEQISSARNTDERSDVWALGTVLYEAVTGKIAFEGEYPEVFVVISTREPPPVRSLRPEAPVELETVIERCLRKAKEDRYPSMTELKRALQSLEQEILPARNRPNYTIPSPPMSTQASSRRAPNEPTLLAADGMKSATKTHDEFPTNPAPPMTPDAVVRPLPLPPTPAVPFLATGQVYANAVGANGAIENERPHAALFDDVETQIEPPHALMQPTERIDEEPSRRKGLWIGASVALLVLLLGVGLRTLLAPAPVVQGGVPAATPPAKVESPSVVPPPSEPSGVVAEVAPSFHESMQSAPIASTTASAGKGAGKTSKAAGQPSGGQTTSTAASAPKTNTPPNKPPVLPAEAHTPSADDIGRRK